MAAKTVDQSRRVKRAKRELRNDIIKSAVSGVATLVCVAGIFMSAAGDPSEEKVSVSEKGFWVMIFATASVGGGIGTLWTLRNVSYSAHKYDCIKESVQQEYETRDHHLQSRTPEQRP